MIGDKSLSDSADDDPDADLFRQSRACYECGEALRSGERLVRVEHGECTPYGMALVDVASDIYTQTHTYYFHKWCAPTELTATDNVDDERNR